MNLLVVVPTFNERDNLPALVDALMRHQGLRVLVVDDRSPDGTGEIAERLAEAFPSRIEVLHRTGPRGLGRSLVEGLGRARASDAELVCQMDADLSHDPEYIPQMVEAAQHFDLVVGSRYLRGISVVNWPLHRIMLSAFANRYIRHVAGLQVMDCTSGFRCWRRHALAKLPLQRTVSEGYAFLVETLFDAVRGGCRVGEIPIIFIERRHGQSKLSARVMIESFVMPWRLAWRRLVRWR